MKIVSVILISNLFCSCMSGKSHLSKNFIDYINSKQTSWTAGQNFPEDISTENLKNLVGTLFEPRNFKIPMKVHKITPEEIPETFDGREYWPHCESLKDIRNQGACASCWAFGAAEAITDRTCILSNGTIKFRHSPNDALTCCRFCGGCNGGYMNRAWEYWVQNGLVSGGDYNSKEGCQPYHEDAAKNGIKPECSLTCLNKNYSIPYEEDKRHGESFYTVTRLDVQQIQTEIFKNGPVQAGYSVYEDFYNYKSGVYVHTAGERTGGHAVKIIGWGTENGLPYWLIANSWGKSWGGLGGFFKILRGQNHCGIEEWAFGGIPKL